MTRNLVAVLIVLLLFHAMSDWQSVRGDDEYVRHSYGCWIGPVRTSISVRETKCENWLTSMDNPPLSFKSVIDRAERSAVAFEAKARDEQNTKANLPSVRLGPLLSRIILVRSGDVGWFYWVDFHWLPVSVNFSGSAFPDTSFAILLDGSVKSPTPMHIPAEIGQLPRLGQNSDVSREDDFRKTKLFGAAFETLIPEPLRPSTASPPEWLSKSDNPPISAKMAVSRAEKTMLMWRKVTAREPKLHDLNESIFSLDRLVLNNNHWWVIYKVADKTSTPSSVIGEVAFAVLFDGKVLEPKRVPKQD